MCSYVDQCVVLVTKFFRELHGGFMPSIVLTFFDLSFVMGSLRRQTQGSQISLLIEQYKFTFEETQRVGGHCLPSSCFLQGILIQA